VTPSGASRAKGYAIALDVGGTFTDVALVHETSGRLWITKTPTTPHDPSAGFITGVDRALRLAGVEPASLRHVLHGTTTATNAILEGKGAATGLLTTAGFRHVLEIGRHDIPRRANMFAWVKPSRPVSPDLIFEIGGRVTVDGAELEPLDEETVSAAARRLREAGVDSIAVCFLRSYANPAHERRTRPCSSRSTPAPRCRCPARCCRCSASSSGRWARSSTPTCSLSSGATSRDWWESCAREGSRPRSRS